MITRRWRTAAARPVPATSPSGRPDPRREVTDMSEIKEINTLGDI
ncbi:hypothetical protein SHJG_1020 [Streptomyces hygroscopicus subsp. jinggangensis 5008]|nr:hypothetical protein SHJG_1020 [Streptomyces hygroscopicus subsp. jinggangensis 5008]AGF60519.1 hypothetical protein SHJGH_0853 [Streptomyces hygroscopicus subsp. jinggangensis TL01]